MHRTTTRLLGTVALTLAVCLPLHYLAAIDWPRALAIGLVAAIVIRAITSHRGQRGARVKDV